MCAWQELMKSNETPDETMEDAVTPAQHTQIHPTCSGAHRMPQAPALPESHCTSNADDEESSYSPARSLASRMLRAASNALWWREEETDVGRPSDAGKAQLSSFFTERAKYIPLRLELRERCTSPPTMLPICIQRLHITPWVCAVRSSATSLRASPA